MENDDPIFYLRKHPAIRVNIFSAYNMFIVDTYDADGSCYSRREIPFDLVTDEMILQMIKTTLIHTALDKENPVIK